MLVTKHAAELCALLVSDLYGELPSRIVVALLTKGRSPIGQLCQYTSLSPKQIRNGLGVLIQQNLIYHVTVDETTPTIYEANPLACYNLIRSGKILEVIESQYGTAERDIVQFLLLSGHAKISDVMQAFESRATRSNGHTNGGSTMHSQELGSEEDIAAVLKRLIQAGIIEQVQPKSFQNPADVYRAIESEAVKLQPGEKMTAKERAARVLGAKHEYQNFREERKAIKKKLDGGGFSYKRRKLEDDVFHENGWVPLDPTTIIRVDHERCDVELRNRHLANFAASSLGDVTGEVYRAFLNVLTTKLSTCRVEPILTDIVSPPEISVTTMDVFDYLDPNVDVGSGIGRVPKDMIDTQSAQKIRKSAPEGNTDSEDSEEELNGLPHASVSLDEDDEDEESSDDTLPTAHHRHSAITNGGHHARVKFEDDGPAPDSRMELMRKHLLVLAESKYRFVRHCGFEGRGKWTVDFDRLMRKLRAAEVDAYIEQSFGRQGLRLTRMLREKGKVEEKNLTLTVHMTMTHIQEKFLALQMAGVVDVQEVPKDNSRTANRTLFFWYFDGDRAEAQLLDSVYKGMVRCLQVLQVERHRERNILSFVERRDVQGQEEEVMTPEHYNKYNRHLELQNKLLGQVMRLDDIAGVLRDF